MCWLFKHVEEDCEWACKAIIAKRIKGAVYKILLQRLGVTLSNVSSKTRKKSPQRKKKSFAQQFCLIVLGLH